MKNKLSKNFFIFFALIFFSIAGAQKGIAQNPCDCAAPWIKHTGNTLNIVLSNTCCYTAKYVYYTRTCNGVLQFKYDKAAVSYDPSSACNVGKNCNVSGSQCDEIHKLIEKDIVINKELIGINGTIQSASPSSCRYVLEVIPSQGLKDCFNDPGGLNKYYITGPCDVNGCCLTTLTHNRNGTISRTVNNSLPCGTLTLGSTDSVEIGCDIIGGGSTYFTCSIVPNQTVTCNPTCNPATYKKDPLGLNFDETINSSTISAYPNPFYDNTIVTFTTEIAGRKAYLYLMDASGKVVINQIFQTSTGEQSFTVDTKALSAGLYICRIVVDNTIKEVKITKTK